MNWYSKVVKDWGEIPNCIQYFETELKDARNEVKIKGNIESVSVASATTITPNIDSSEMEIVSALASALTIAVPTGVTSSFYEGKELTLRIKDNGTARALTWNAIFVDYTGILPSTTVASKTVYIGCKYNVVDTKWDVVAVQVQP